MRGAGRGTRAIVDLAVPRLHYAPGAGNAPHVALPCGTRADQTCLALFFFLRLGRRTRLRQSTCIAGTQAARVRRCAALRCGRARRWG